MDQIINYLLLTIIFVFDPLAIALVVAANFAFDQIRPRTKENLYGEKVEIKDEKEEFNKNLSEALDSIGEEEILEELFDRPDREMKMPEDEERMNIIGQNGNTGEHYAEEEKPKKESYVKPGYVKSPSLTLPQEVAEISRIMGKDLTAKQIEDLKASKLTKTFNDDDDLIIRY